MLTGWVMIGAFCAFASAQSWQGKSDSHPLLPPPEPVTFSPIGSATACQDPDKEFNSCGTMCPEGCDNYADSQIKPCPAACKSGCFCKKGMILEDSEDHDSRCVTPVMCTNADSCPDPRKEWSQCGSNCPIGCNALQPRSCDRSCVEDCFCMTGFLLQDAYNRKSPCVRESECQTNGVCPAMSLSTVFSFPGLLFLSRIL